MDRRREEASFSGSIRTASPRWRGATIYEVYVRSLADSDGDGQGDLPGLTARLDYFVELGVEALWLSPVSPSPNFDSGYDVGDYRGIEPAFGTTDDFRTRRWACADAAGDKLLLAEICCANQIERMAEYAQTGHLHTAYSFKRLGPSFDGADIVPTVLAAEAGDAWLSWAISNHDLAQVTSRWGAVGNLAPIKMLQALLLILRGTVIRYQGEELGLSRSDMPRKLAARGTVHAGAITEGSINGNGYVILCGAP